MAEIGARLRDARLRLGVDINEVEMRTKVRAKYLRAMENEEWDLLPGDVYVRSFLRSYGEYLGLDTRQLIDDFRRQYETPSDHEPPPIVPPSRQTDRRVRGRGGRRPRVAPWAATVLVLAVVVVVLYLVGSSGSTSHHDTRTPAAQTHRHRTTIRRGKRPRRRRVSSAPQRVRLTLVPTGTVYVCLVDGGGRKLIPGRIYAAGETIPVQTGTKLLLTLGNAAVTLKENGVTIPVAASGTAIGYRFTPGHHAVLPASEQPSCT